MVLRQELVCRIAFRWLLTVFLVISLLAGSGVSVAGDLQTLLISVVRTSTLAETRELLGETLDAADDLVTVQHRPVRTWNTRFTKQPGSFLQVRVLEGRTAFISVSRRKPELRLLWVEETNYGSVPNVGFSSRESSAGFFVEAELEEGVVVLQLEYYSDQSLTESSSSNAGQAVRTLVSGRPGEWLDVGGSIELPEQVPGLRIYSVDTADDDQFRVLVKVELAP